MRPMYLLALLALMAGCGGTTVSETSSSVGETLPTPSVTADPTDTPTPEATPSPTPEATPSPTPEPEPEAVEVLGIAQVGTDLTVRLRNPNEDVGLVRSGFELAILDSEGAILGVEGSSGLPGASCCTIYQLPPGGEYGLVTFVSEGQAADVELTITGDWEEWDALDPAIVTVTDASVQADPGFGGPTVTGRVQVDQDGPFNVVVMAYVETSAGVVVATGVAECATAGAARAFEAQSFGDVRGPYTLAQVIAYPTTVEGAGDSFTPDC